MNNIKIRFQNKEIAAAILAVFEQFLTDRGVVIPTSEKEKAQDEDLVDGAIIYGHDYYELEDAVLNILERSDK